MRGRERQATEASVGEKENISSLKVVAVTCAEGVARLATRDIRAAVQAGVGGGRHISGSRL